jgi:hypothetical protein
MAKAKTSWIDRLSEAGQKAKAEKTPAKPRPKVSQIQITTRPSNPESGDPGACRIGHWYLADSHVYLSDADGNPLTDANGVPLSIELQDGANPASLACVLLRERVRGDSKNGFERGPLNYGPTGWR